MEPEPETGMMQRFAESDFRRGVLSLDGSHHPGAGICVHHVCQWLRPS